MIEYVPIILGAAIVVGGFVVCILAPRKKPETVAATIQRLKINPGDRLVVIPAYRITKQDADFLLDDIKKAIPDSVRVMIFQPGTQLTVLAMQEAEQI